MFAEVMAIGDELTSGQRLDTNSQWLSLQLGELGIPTRFHSTVSDDVVAMTAAIRASAGRSDVLIITGGLGPTADDLTREAIAAAADVTLVTDDDILRDLQDLFASRGRAMPESNRVQAMFPEGSQPIRNPHGTAPGILLELSSNAGAACQVFALPGVPAEMREMWFDSVSSALNGMTDHPQIVHHRRIKCFGEGESAMEARLPDLIHRQRDPYVGITVHAATITFRITAQAATLPECEAKMQPTIDAIHDCLGDLVFGQEDDELQHVVVALLRERNQTLATAECGTSGRLGHWLSEPDEAVGVYRGGLVSAAETAAHLVTGGRMLAENGAATCREQFGADYALSIGPLPTSDVAGEEPAEFYYALATPDEVILRTGSTAGHPEILKDRAAKQALNLLRLELLKQVQ